MCQIVDDWTIRWAVDENEDLVNDGVHVMVYMYLTKIFMKTFKDI